MKVLFTIILLLQAGYTVETGPAYLQFPDYAQIRYPDGRYCVLAPYEKLLINEKEPMECIRISSKYKDGIIPSSCSDNNPYIKSSGSSRTKEVVVTLR